MKRDVVAIAGPDAEAFLQGQLSQDVVRLAEGQSSYTFLLEPQGKVVVWGRVTRVGPDAFELDVDCGFGERAVTRLNRFKLRTKAEVSLVASAERPELVWPGLEAGDESSYERRRISAALPALGCELDENTIPAEAGRQVIEQSVSFTKGCYTGQELVARVDSRGSNTPRKLRRVTIDDGVPQPGATVLVDGRDSGTLTSVAPRAGGGAVALALAKRDVPPGEVEARVGDLAARIAPQ